MFNTAIMSQHRFWRGLSPVNVLSNEYFPDKVVKLCAVENNYLFLTNNHNIYLCSIENEHLHSEKVTGISALDISYHKGVVYMIDTYGRLYKTSPSFDKREEIVVKEDAKCCSHGFKSSSSKVRFRNVVTNDFGKLFTTSDGQLWGSGNMPEIAIVSDSIKKVPFFEGRTVYSAAIGNNFAAVITRKNVCRSGNCDSDSENDEEVFATNCSQCQNIIGISSPVSMTSLSETCPLGVQINKSSEDSSSTSAPQTDVHVDSFTEDSSHSSDDPKLIPNNVQDKEISKETCDKTTNENEDTSNLEKPEADNDKTNNIFINADAAKQFLSKQLSWVSAGEDYLVEYTEKPTRIIKENVSNLTNLVFEGVKTVGDKVVTLSRHVSGSSDTNDITDLLIKKHNDDIHRLLHNCNSRNCIEEQCSISSLSSNKEYETTRKNDNIKNMSKLGKNILATELWTWGDISYGQLGVGDTIKRLKPVVVTSLSGCGLQKVSSGLFHCSTLTLDGRLFSWGYNHYHQVALDSRVDRSSPQKFKENLDSDRVRDMIAIENRTIIYTHSENIFYLGKHRDGFTQTVTNLNKKIDEDPPLANGNEIALVKINDTKHNSKTEIQSMCYHGRILSSGELSYCYIEDNQRSPEYQDLSISQRYLEEMLLIHRLVIKPFVKKTKAISSHTDLYENVCDIFSDIVNLTALNVLSMWQFVEKHIAECDISLIKNLEEYIFLYKKYCIALSNLIVIGGFAQINNIVDIPTRVYNLFIDQLPTNKQKSNKKTLEVVVGLTFVQPLTRLSSYKCIAQSLLRNKNKNKSETKLNIEDRLNRIITALDNLIEEQEKCKREAEMTKLFWETSGKSLEQYRTPERRLIRESKSRPLSLVNPGRFSSHWFVLFNDLFVHICGSTPYIYPLETVWVESVPNTDTVKNVIQITTPEEVISVTTFSEEEKTEWIQNFNNSIKSVLNKDSSFKPPAARTAFYTFSNKNSFYKEAKYNGRWIDGKLDGSGIVEWPDGKSYKGQFQHNTLCGHGKMETPGIGTYEGQWKDNHQNGFGVLKYSNGDLHEGYFKDGQPHGHGIRKQGDFTSSSATIYTGEWLNGVKHGYGVMDDIGKGEKYLGNWSDNKKQGCGLIVTLDGIYYEGLFMHDVLTGHGVMIFEDGTHYEGEFRAAGVFAGKGTLTFSSGDKIEGSLSGAWTEGVKISNATMRLNVSNPTLPENPKPSSFGKLCVAPNQKWNALFKQCYQHLGIPESLLTPTASHFTQTVTTQPIDNKKIWQNVAVAINCSHKDKNKIKSKLPKGMSQIVDVSQTVDSLEVIPQFGQKNLNLQEYTELKSYLQSACESSHHPLGRLVLSVTNAFNTTYGGVIVHPLLLSHAVKELKSITSRLYQVVRVLFPALPVEGVESVLSRDCKDNEESNPINGELVSPALLLQASLLPRVHPALFVLYALTNKREDDAYWRRLTKWNKQPDLTLMALLGVDPKFLTSYTSNGQMSPSLPPVKDQLFQEAVETLQQLKTTFSPIEKLLVIRSTFQKMTAAVQKELGENYIWCMDELFPVFHFVVVRARILQLGSEINFVEDFLEPSMQHGELGIMFTTLKACYFQILQEKMSITA